MADKTYFGSSVRAGATPSESTDAGHAILVKQVTLQAAGGATENAQVVLPAKSALLDLTFDTTVAHTAATITLKAGITAGGSEYASSTNIKAAGRIRPTFTAAQLAAMADTTSNTTVYFQAAAGTPTSTGTTIITVMYRMRANGE